MDRSGEREAGKKVEKVVEKEAKAGMVQMVECWAAAEEMAAEVATEVDGRSAVKAGVGKSIAVAELEAEEILSRSPHASSLTQMKIRVPKTAWEGEVAQAACLRAPST